MVGEQPQGKSDGSEPCEWDEKSQRLKDSRGYRLRAAGLCVRIENDEKQYLLVTGRNNHSHWVKYVLIFPSKILGGARGR